jgi:hypothetical protein
MTLVTKIAWLKYGGFTKTTYYLLGAWMVESKKDSRSSYQMEA